MGSSECFFAFDTLVTNTISISSFSEFSEYILCVKTSFHLIQVTLAEWERSAVLIVWFTVRILLVSLIYFNFYNCEWHERAIFMHLPKDTCATAIGLPSRL